jgi:medium-chain acyl-[acyl-carrier-protein] hydrolase
MEAQTIWHTETRVKTYETDFRGKWRPASFVQAMIEAATEHAAALGYDYPTMVAHDMVWVLSRFKVRFDEFPAVTEKVKIKTWPKGIQQKLFFMRDFELRGQDGRRLAAASFAWLLISPTARRLLFPTAITQAFGRSVPDNGGLSALDESLERISLPAGLEERSEVDASYSAVDMLGHATAARYVEWVTDCFSQAEHAGRQLAWLQVNYLNETRPGERLSLAAGTDGGDHERWYVQGTNLNTGQKSFEAAFSWSVHG